MVGVARAEIAVVAARCGLAEEEIHNVRLAVSEVVTNAIVHGYAESSGEVRIQAFAEDGELQIVVADDGPGMAPRVESPGLGLGLPLAATVAGDLRVVSPDGGGTEVHLTFACPTVVAG
jgi:serine/threonine-protein kinase RsbW/stage II sporulation protein AB (anti-sigma F factor)